MSRPRVSLGLSATFFALLLTGSPASAQSATYTWDTSTTDNAWLNPANWTGNPGFTPGSTSGSLPTEGNALDTAVFGTISSAVGSSGVGIDFSNGTGAQGNLNVGAIWLTTGTGGDLRIGNSSTTTDGSINLNGQTINSVANVVLANDSGNRNLIIDSAPVGSGTKTTILTIGGIVPNSVFLVTTGGTITINSQITQFTLGSGFTVQGGGTVVLGAANSFDGAVVVTGGSTLSVSQDLNFGIAPSSATAGKIVLDSGTLNVTTGFTLNSNRGLAINAGGGTFNIASGQTLTYGGIIAGAGALTKSGAGTLTLSGTNTYTGVTNINAGTVLFTSTAALGATGAGNETFVASSASLTIGNNAINPAETLTLNGTGTANEGAFRKIGTTNSNWTAAITIGSATRINNDSTGLLTLSGAIGAGANALTVGGTGNTTISGVITGSGTLTHDSASTLVVSGGNSATFTGPITVTNGGVLSYPNQTSLGTASGSGVITLDNGTLLNTITGSAGTFSPTTRNIVLGAGGGTLQWNGDAVSTDLIIVQTGTVISGSGGLTKAGNGIIAVVTPATYTGPTVVAGGTLRVRTNNNVFPTGTALTVNSGGTFDLSNLNQQVGSVAGAGNVTIGGGIFTVNGATSTTFSGVISGTGAVTKAGTSTLTLSGNNTYSGLTTISTGGTLKLGSSTGLGFGGAHTTAAGTTVSSGGTLDLNGITGINEAITLNGTGVGSNGVLINGNTGATARISNGVAAVTRTSGGTGIPSSSTITVSGGGGSGAAATASFGLTSASFTINSGTTTYSVAPTVTVSGSGVATAILDGTTHLVTGVTITNIGSGYTTAPTITFSAGTVLVAGTNPTGTGNANNFTVANVTITNPGSGYTSAPTFTIGNATFAPQLSSVVLGSNSSIGGAGDFIIDGVVSGGTNTLTKVGAGALTLNGVNTYTGATNVNAGTLLVGTGGSLTSGSAVTVNNTGTLGGTGTVNGAVTVMTGGTIRGGNASGVGTLTLGNGLTMASGANLGIRLSDGSTPSVTPGGSTLGTLPNPTSNNYINITGGLLTANPTTIHIVVDGTGTTFTSGQSYSYQVGAVTGQDLSAINITNQSQFTAIGFTDQYNFSLTGNASGAVFLSFTPVPEPATVLGIAVGAMGLGGLVRRRLRNA